MLNRLFDLINHRDIIKDQKEHIIAINDVIQSQKKSLELRQQEATVLQKIIDIKDERITQLEAALENSIKVLDLIESIRQKEFVVAFSKTFDVKEIETGVYVIKLTEVQYPLVVGIFLFHGYEYAGCDTFVNKSTNTNVLFEVV
jgi:hypothetical protein